MVPIWAIPPRQRIVLGAFESDPSADDETMYVAFEDLVRPVSAVQFPSWAHVLGVEVVSEQPTDQTLVLQIRTDAPLHCPSTLHVVFRDSAGHLLGGLHETVEPFSALKVLEKHQGHCPDRAHAAATVTVVAALTAFSAEIPGLNVALAAEALNLVGTLASQRPLESQNVAIGGATVLMILHSTGRALNLIAQEYDAGTAMLTDGLKAINSWIMRQGDGLCPSPPSGLSGMATAGLDTLDGQHSFYDR
jgi:hypothetical protein